jgi:hypothetical protein
VPAHGARNEHEKAFAHWDDARGADN